MANELALETSPYLLQHADNPVHWYPWGPEALERARREDKPILLSIGYSACHWCHVMAHESFEDSDTAAVMNAKFVNIKVDREERPDLDQIYQRAHHLLTRRNGGWPLTMFLTPDQKPFFGGTYFPPAPRHGLPAFRTLLAQVEQAFRERRQDIEAQNDSLMRALGDAGESGTTERGEPPRSVIDAAIADLVGTVDPRWGGFGGAPKFPHPQELQFCLHHFAATGDVAARDAALLTLARMAEGGIHDQLGGGFARYSVDDTWSIPHFEKMLYDNGPLLGLYGQAWSLTGEPRWLTPAERIVAWLKSEMRAPEGAFYSSLDADSEGEEGRFYVWERDEVQRLLSAEQYAVAAPHWGLDQPPNFEGRAWHLRVCRPMEDVARQLGQPLAAVQIAIEQARQVLIAARGARVRPARDDKILTSWNALMISGLARAGTALGRHDWIVLAQEAADFIRTTMLADGRLLATARAGRAHLDAYLDDHAFLLEALLLLLQAEFRLADLDFARSIADSLLDRFEDTAHGGFYFTAHDHEPLIQRPKPATDGATPSGNGIAARALIRLGHLLGEARYLDAAARTLRAFTPLLERAPGACVSLAAALREHLDPPTVVVLRGPEPELGHWRDALHREYAPGALVVAIPPGTAPLPDPLDKPAHGDVNAWICRGVTCLPPTNSLEQALRDCKAVQLV